MAFLDKYSVLTKIILSSSNSSSSVISRRGLRGTLQCKTQTTIFKVK